MNIPGELSIFSIIGGASKPVLFSIKTRIGCFKALANILTPIDSYLSATRLGNPFSKSLEA